MTPSKERWLNRGLAPDNQTIAYLNAEVARAEQQGARSMDISLLDLKDVLRAAESGFALERSEKAGKHAGWVKPGSLAALRSGKKLFTRISRRRSDEFNTELFFAGDLQEKRQEVIDTLAANAAAPQNYATKEGAVNE
mgnify:FL=1